MRPDVEVLGLEIDPERVRIASASARPGVSFALGGFEVPTPDDRRPVVIRALNVLRQYEETEVPEAWARMLARLQPDGVLVEGTCSELGRVAAWATLRPAGGGGPDALTLRPWTASGAHVSGASPSSPATTASGVPWPTPVAPSEP